jgi:hypothetical protein
MIFSITVGKYRQSGSQALFSFDSSTKIEYPLDAYKLVLKALGGSFGTSQIDCNVKQEILYNINGMDLHLKPDDYLDRSKQNTSGECRFLGKFGNLLNRQISLKCRKTNFRFHLCVACLNSKQNMRPLRLQKQSNGIFTSS